MKTLVQIALALLMTAQAASASVEVEVDFNVPMAIDSIANDRSYYSGTVSSALHGSRFELAVPFFFNEHIYDSNICCVVNIERFDLQLRSFQNTERVGPYIGIVGRISTVSGQLYLDNSKPISYSRLGIGVVTGFRTEVRNNIFWGANLNLGIFTSDGDLLANGSTDAFFFGPTDNGGKFFFNIEFLKIGVRF